MQRRTFLAGAVATGVAASLPRATAELLGHGPQGKPQRDTEGETVDAGPADLDVIDCHTHFYDPTRPQGVPWPPKDSPLYREVYPKDLRAEPQFRKLTGTVVVEASDWVEDTGWLLDLAKDDPFLVGIVGRLYPGEPEFAEQLKRYAANPLFRGIRALVGPLKKSLERNELEDYKRLADADVALDVNGGPETPTVVAELAKRLPSLRIVINHIGNVRIDENPPPKAWREAFRVAGERPNVFGKISGLVEGASMGGREAPGDVDFYRPFVDVVWDALGDERVIYGSNWPVCEVGADYATTQRIALEYAFDKGEQPTRNFCSLNARRAYKWLDRDGRKTS